MRNVSLLVLLLPLACGPGSGDDDDETTSGAETTGSTSSTTPSSSSSGSTGTDTDENCDPPAENLALEACALPDPCDSIFTYGEFGDTCVGQLQLDDSPYEADEICVLEALAAGQPAVVRATGTCPDTVIDDAVFLVGAGVVFLSESSGGPCFGCGCMDYSESWQPVRRCALNDPSYFESCLAETDQDARIACMTVSNWYADCVEAPAACGD